MLLFTTVAASHLSMGQYTATWDNQQFFWPCQILTNSKFFQGRGIIQSVRKHWLRTFHMLSTLLCYLVIIANHNTLQTEANFLSSAHLFDKVVSQCIWGVVRTVNFLRVFFWVWQWKILEMGQQLVKLQEKSFFFDS